MNDLTIAEPIAVDTIRSRILTIRGVQVMLDRDLAELYGVPTGALNQAVKRNIRRFPESFMFQLTKTEFENWKSQTVISKSFRAKITAAIEVSPHSYLNPLLLSSIFLPPRLLERMVYLARISVFTAKNYTVNGVSPHNFLSPRTTALISTL